VARQPRLAMAGELHLVAVGGHNGNPVATDDVDRSAFHDMAVQAVGEQGVAVHAYVITETDVRWLATPAKDESLGRMMQALGRRYAAFFNRRHGRQGALWEGRFRSSVLEAEAWLRDATLHLEWLPLRAGLVTRADEWRWSSAAHHLGRLRDALVTEHPLHWASGNTPFERELAHAHALTEDCQANRTALLDDAERGGRVLGAPVFVHGLSERTGRRFEPRPRGRPRKT
jgi:putative transposase